MTAAVQPSPLESDPAARETALGVVALAATLLFAHGQTTERTVVAAERLGSALGLPARVLPDWDKLTVELEGTSLSRIVATKPLGVDMNRVLAITTVVDRLCDGMLSIEEARAALLLAGSLPPISTLQFALFAAIGAASLGVIFGALDSTSLVLIGTSAALGALVRRRLSIFSNPFVQPLCAALIASIIAAISTVSLREPIATALVAFCPSMVLVPGPHLLNGAIDLVRTRTALGIARLTYAGTIVLMICFGLLLGFTVSGPIQAARPSLPVPLLADVVAAGCAVASFGTLFSMPWRMLPLPVAAGMIGHAARWSLISLAGANVATGALVACVLVSVIVTPVVDRFHLPFAALGFSAVVSMIPGFFLFEAARALVELVSLGPHAPTVLLTNIAANGATAFLVILAMTFGLILPRIILEDRSQ
ncbi:threonine/serine ThrE exporter family protein [Bradyrhizobium uaiense]|uniref:Threonine/serine exporter family protein n=1 Tax=Bradyrhizobium uaiense TaxID=2594946 RepID=A0A6P1BJD0_9BRAD|nr:threonine/serine exporter family protein [Bradyrhizobium uaiense]NEU98646.1 threonine/serine exporter family protein [Bradyrhizobium uaiense]